MKHVALFVVFLGTLASGQTGSGKAQTSGSCSPAVTGNSNQFTITCQGIDAKLRTQLVDLINRIAQNQSEAEAMMKKLDSCVAGVTPRKLSPEEAGILDAFLSSAPPGTVLINASVNAGDARQYANQIAGLLTKHGWSVKIGNTMFVNFTPGQDTPRGMWTAVKDGNNAPVSAGVLQHAFAAAHMNVGAEIDISINDASATVLNISLPELPQ